MRWILTLVLLCGCVRQNNTATTHELTPEEARWEAAKKLSKEQDQQIRDYLTRQPAVDGLTTDPTLLNKLEAPSTVSALAVE
jgi:hypothetical protein